GEVGEAGGGRPAGFVGAGDAVALEQGAEGHAGVYPYLEEGYSVLVF
ncbi:MAG: hypothetical protein GYA88_04210, partial [Clostridiales bacterium]|nr:hypothetical protein [Clostridiales bacterium]